MNIKLLYGSLGVLTNVFNDYSSIVCEAKYKVIYRKGIPSISARLTHGRADKASNHSNFKKLSLKQMLQRFQKALA